MTRIHMKQLPTFAIVAILLFATHVTMAQTPQGSDAARTNSDPAIVEKLREIVTIRQKLTEANERAVQNGKGQTDGRYKLALAEARLDLARELGQKNEEITALQGILKVQQRRLREAESRMLVGAAGPSDVDAVRVEVLEVEVRLLRAQRSSKS